MDPFQLVSSTWRQIVQKNSFFKCTIENHGVSNLSVMSLTKGRLGPDYWIKGLHETQLKIRKERIEKMGIKPACLVEFSGFNIIWPIPWWQCVCFDAVKVVASRGWMRRIAADSIRLNRWRQHDPFYRKNCIQLQSESQVPCDLYFKALFLLRKQGIWKLCQRNS